MRDALRAELLRRLKASPSGFDITKLGGDELLSLFDSASRRYENEKTGASWAEYCRMRAEVARRLSPPTHVIDDRSGRTYAIDAKVGVAITKAEYDTRREAGLLS